MNGMDENLLFYPLWVGESSITWDWVWQLGDVRDAAGSTGCDGQMQGDSGSAGDGQEHVSSVLPSPGQWEKGQGFILTVRCFYPEWRWQDQYPSCFASAYSYIFSSQVATSSQPHISKMTCNLYLTDDIDLFRCLFLSSQCCRHSCWLGGKERKAQLQITSSPSMPQIYQEVERIMLGSWGMVHFTCHPFIHLWSVCKMWNNNQVFIFFHMLCRSNLMGTKFSVFDNALHPERALPDLSNARQELAGIIYVRY